MHKSGATKLAVPPILCSIEQAAAALSRGTTKIYELIGSGEIVAVRSDRRTLVRYDSLQRYADKLARDHRAVVARRPKRKPQRQRKVFVSHSRKVFVSHSAQDQERANRNVGEWIKLFPVGHSAQDQERANRNVREWVKTLEAEAADVRRQLAETQMSERERVSKEAYVAILLLLPQLSDAELNRGC